MGTDKEQLPEFIQIESSDEDALILEGEFVSNVLTLNGFQNDNNFELIGNFSKSEDDQYQLNGDFTIEMESVYNLKGDWTATKKESD